MAKIVKIKINQAEIPEKAHRCDAAYDIRCNKETIVSPSRITKLSTGIFLQIPVGMELQIWPRGSGTLKGLYIHPGTVDSNYRGEVFILVTPLIGKRIIVEKGEAVAQGKFVKTSNIEFKLVKRLSQSTRGSGSLGSTGKKGGKR